MKMLLLLLIFIPYTYAYVDQDVLTSLQSLDHWNTFRIVLPHTTEECFYLETKLDDTIHVIYQVLKGGDSRIRATISNPVGNITFARADSEFGWYDEEDSKIPGTYRLCFKNEQYFTSKTIYIGVLAVHRDRLAEANLNAAEEKRKNETAAIEEFSTNITKTLIDVSVRLYRVTAYQTMSRIHEAHDLYQLEANESYVQYWAICQIITMITCSMIQVFSIRHLFKSRISTKPSAHKISNQYIPPQSSPHFIIG